MSDNWLDEIIATWRGPLVGQFAAWGVPWRDASDLAQDTFAECYLSKDRFRGDFNNRAQAGAWLRGIARNVYFSWKRKRDKTPAELADDLYHLPSSNLEDEKHTLIREALDALPAAYKTVLYLHYLESTPVRNIATFLDESEKAIESRLYHARKALKKVLDSKAKNAGMQDTVR